MKKNVLMSVSNDLYTDQRVFKMAHHLVGLGFEVTVIGIRRPTSPELPKTSFKVERLPIYFKRGVLFYAELQIRLLFKLIAHPKAILHANDLDTLLPNFLVSKLKSSPLVYDTHEFFTGVPELEHKSFSKWVWTQLEAFILPRLPFIITVNASIKKLYEALYPQLNLKVIRNIPERQHITQWKTREELGLPTSITICILQGNGINKDRGAEELILAMKTVENVLLLIIGNGDLWPTLERLVEEEQLQSKILLKTRLSYQELIHYTHNADIGLSLDKPTNLNYQNSLPNKIFDYMACGLAFIISPIKEPRQLVETYDLGLVLEEVTPEAISTAINNLSTHQETLQRFKANASKVKDQFTWEHDFLVMEDIYHSICNTKDS